RRKHADMKIEWDAPIKMDDGLMLRADVFRPDDGGRHPAILSYGPYGKGLAFQEGYKTAWEIMARENPDALAGSSNRYQNWEVVDPEKWVPEGYAIVRVDSRGAGRSPGYLCHNNARETRDLHLCIEWAAAQKRCSGKIAMNGISYYASSQCRAAATQPPHLAASAAPISRRSQCRCFPPPTGAGRACTRAATSRALSAPHPRTNGWKCTAARTGPRSTPITAASCSSTSSITS